MNKPYTPGQVVKVSRPGRQMDKWVGRFLDYAPVPEHFGWVAFGLAGATYTAPDEKIYRKQDKAQHKLLPLSQLHAL